MRFLKDEIARVPFAVIGVFLILISTMVSINLMRQDVRMAKTMSSSLEVTSGDEAMQFARADIARAMNYAGMEALKQIGETPVIKPDNNSEYYNGSADEFNRNRARAIIRDTLNQYIESNYMNDTFVHHEFSVNLDQVESWKNITIAQVNMSLKERVKPPLLAPGKDTGYGTYWKVAVPLNFHLKDLKTNTESMNREMTMETIITSRYPLLKDLTDEYGERLNGTNAVMTETTAFAMAYTWGRGYLQYSGGAPLNIVDNRHLALIMNGVLLLDQGFVFNSVDPMSLVEYANQTAVTLSGKNMGYGEVSLDNGSLRIDPQQDAYNSTEDPDTARKESGSAARFDYNATSIMEHLNNESQPGGSIVKRQIRKVTPQVYSTTLATGVARQVAEKEGPHDGYETSYAAEDWGEPDTMMQKGMIPVDSNVPGNLYGEIWEVTWTRNHVWRHYYTVYYACKKTRSYECSDEEGNPSTCTEEYWDTCSRTEYNEMTTTDRRMDTVSITLKALENSKVNIPLNYAGRTLSTGNDVEKAYNPAGVSYNRPHTDPNLEEAYLRYRSESFDPDKIDNIKNQGLNGVYFSALYSSASPEPHAISAPDWAQQEAKYAVNDITASIRNDVHLDPGINYRTYPVPSDFLEAARDDLIMKIERNETRYLNKSNYWDGMYSSASAKLISVIREWYVDEVKHQIREKFTGGSDEINRKIKENFSEDVKDANRNAAKFLSEGMNLPLGLKMKAEHVDEKGKVYAPDELEAWNESVTLSINQEPNYLFMDGPASNKKLITLGVRNINIFGPTGLPILPTFDPWLAQMNAWKIEVQGKMNKFEVQDIDNEVHPNPIFGHDAQVYVRMDKTVFDSLSDLPLGENQPIRFSFTTGTFILVPPGKTIGDKEGGIDEKSPYYNKII